MFERMKKWFKRPIVIKFTVEPLDLGNSIYVLTSNIEITPNIAEAIKKSWPSHYKSRLIVLNGGFSLQQLTDELLNENGLMRIEIDGESGLWHGPIKEYPTEGMCLYDGKEKVLSIKNHSEFRYEATQTTKQTRSDDT